MGQEYFVSGALHFLSHIIKRYIMSGFPVLSDEDGKVGSGHFSLIPPVSFSSDLSLNGFRS